MKLSSHPQFIALILSKCLSINCVSVLCTAPVKTSLFTALQAKVFFSLTFPFLVRIHNTDLQQPAVFLVHDPFKNVYRAVLFFEYLSSFCCITPNDLLSELYLVIPTDRI